MTRIIKLILLLRWDDSTTRALSDISPTEMNVESVILAKDVANFTLDGIERSGDALSRAIFPLVRNGCYIVDCIRTLIGWARQPSMNAALALDTNLPLVERCLGPVRSYLTPVEMSADKAVKTQ